MDLHKGQTNSGSFKKGQIPWNKGIKGIHFSLATEFKKGRKDKKHSRFMKRLWQNLDFKNKINRKKTKKHREKLRKVNLGKKLSEQTKRKISEMNSGKNHWNWQDGKSFEPYPLGWTKTFKEQIRYKDGYKCQLCGILEVECIRKLDVHHIDYNKKNIKPDNLISLCIQCHRKTNKNKKHWKRKIKCLN